VRRNPIDRLCVLRSGVVTMHTYTHFCRGLVCQHLNNRGANIGIVVHSRAITFLSTATVGNNAATRRLFALPQIKRPLCTFLDTVRWQPCEILVGVQCVKKTFLPRK